MKNKLIDILSNIPSNSHGKKDNVSIEWIRTSEKKYSLSLPLDYFWFIINYDFIFLWGEMTKTVFPPELQEYSDQDVFNYYNIEKSNKLIFLSTEELTDYYFPIIDGTVTDEIYSYEYKSNTEEFIAKNFVDFLIQEIPKNYSL